MWPARHKTSKAAASEKVVLCLHVIFSGVPPRGVRVRAQSRHASGGCISWPLQIGPKNRGVIESLSQATRSSKMIEVGVASKPNGQQRHLAWWALAFVLLLAVLYGRFRVVNLCIADLRPVPLRLALAATALVRALLVVTGVATAAVTTTAASGGGAGARAGRRTSTSAAAAGAGASAATAVSATIAIAGGGGTALLLPAWAAIDGEGGAVATISAFEAGMVHEHSRAARRGDLRKCVAH